MSTITKFYLHDAATTDTGTLPASGAVISATTPASTPALTNKSMDATIGTLQKSVVHTCLANTNAQGDPICRFISAPIAAQTIAADSGSLTSFQCAASESNSNSAFAVFIAVGVWRPSTGSLVGLMIDSLIIGNSGTTETSLVTNTNTLAVTAQDGDVIVIEIWRVVQSQSMATAYTNTVFYDGTTESSITSNAAFFAFAAPITMFTPAAPIPDVTMAQMIGG